jgi:LPXTG-site transpeptidase (sortase) family protein
MLDLVLDNGVPKIKDENGLREVTPRKNGGKVNKGNVGLFGHALPNAFLNIKNLVAGDMIYVYGDNYKATYEVIQSDKVTPDSVNVFFPEKNPVLTLITCDGVFDQYRYMVRAKFIKIEEL